jgi:hypothetical protein
MGKHIYSALSERLLEKTGFSEEKKKKLVMTSGLPSECQKQNLTSETKEGSIKIKMKDQNPYLSAVHLVLSGLSVFNLFQ